MSNRIVQNCLRRTDGASAVEFALVFPLFLIVVFGIVCFGSYLAVAHGVQQIAAEAARASVAGLSDGERRMLAQDNIARNAGSYPFLAPERLKLATAATVSDGNTFEVRIEYDASDMFIFSLPAFVPSPSPTIVRSAAIQRGGY